ncbi:MAG: prepilin peptidase [Alphaproteobacteria bacterium]|nr:prepilin peptidase [Alphaproteobacteria bacterium]
MDFLLHLATLCLIGVLSVLSWIDLKSFRLPDIFTLPLIAAGLGVSLILGTLLLHLVAALIGYGFFFAMEQFYLRVRGLHALGRGDAKLLAAGGAWCGPYLLPLILLIASASALLYIITLGAIRGQMPSAMTRIALGPWLALGFAVCWIFRAYGPGLYPVA